jgi:Kef-type K+ transport system membrane component KefB
MNTTETFLIAMVIIFTLPYLVWRLGRTEYYAPLVVVQILVGIVLGPGVLGAHYPRYYEFVFTPPVVQSLNGLGWWAVMLLVWLAGIELDLGRAWVERRQTGITAALALGVPLLLGAGAAALMSRYNGWLGNETYRWQFILGVGMACAVTALPVLILFLDKLEILRQPIGQRILRYASLDDVAIWSVFALILMDWHRVGMQLAFLAAFALAAYLFRKLMVTVPEVDRGYLALIWLGVCAFGADWCGLHFMVGAFLSGATLDGKWFDQRQMDQLRHHVLLILMPVYFLSTGLRTNWTMGGQAVLFVAAGLLIVSVAGKLAGTHLAGRILNWKPGEVPLIGWLLQTKGLITIVFANTLLDKHIITSETFTALLLMAVGSTMLTVPVVSPMLRRMRGALPGNR